jgi:hypothetical protein
LARTTRIERITLIKREAPIKIRAIRAIRVICVQLFCDLAGTALELVAGTGSIRNAANCLARITRIERITLIKRDVPIKLRAIRVIRAICVQLFCDLAGTALELVAGTGSIRNAANCLARITRIKRITLIKRDAPIKLRAIRVIREICVQLFS